MRASSFNDHGLEARIKTNRNLNYVTLGFMLSLAGDYIDGSTRPIFSNESKEAWTVSAAKSHSCKSDGNDIIAS